jgi:hypothetical protein
MGGKDTADLDVKDSVSSLIQTISQVALKDSGKFVDQDGKDLPY